MNKVQLKRHLELLLKDLTKVNNRMNKIADKLGIDKHEGVESALNDVKLLLAMMPTEELNRE